LITKIIVHYTVCLQIQNFLNEFDRRPMSKKGYTLGARTTARFREYIDVCMHLVFSAQFRVVDTS